MLKKVILAVLLAICAYLSMLLYQQVALLPRHIGDYAQTAAQQTQAHRAEDQAAAGKDAAKPSSELDSKDVMRNWTPSEVAVDEQRSADAESGLNLRDLMDPTARINDLARDAEDRALKDVAPEYDVTRRNVAEPPGPEDAYPRERSTHDNDLHTLSCELTDKGLLLRVATVEPLGKVTHFFLKSPRRLVIDMYGDYGEFPTHDLVPENNLVKDLRTGRHPDRMRVVADMKGETPVTVSIEKKTPTELWVLVVPN